MLDEYGLKCIATHRPWDRLRDNLAAEIAFHKTLGCDYAAIGGIGSNTHEQTYAGYRKWLADARPIVDGLKAEGIRFGHHNHAREFFRPDPAGATLLDIIIDEGGADLMTELDLFWIQHAGANPISTVGRCAGRVPVIHLKDKRVDNPNNNNEISIAAIGEGCMDWPSIIPACEKAGVDWYGIEQDTCDRDPFDCLRSSYDYFQRTFGG